MRLAGWQLFQRLRSKHLLQVLLQFSCLPLPLLIYLIQSGVFVESTDESQGPQPSNPSQNQEGMNTILDSNEHTVMEHNYAEQNTTSTSSGCRDEPAPEGSEGGLPSGDKSAITIKLKYINDELKLVDGKLEEMLGDFKK